MHQTVDVVSPPEVEAPRRGLTLPGLWAFVAVFLPVVAALHASLSSIDLAYQLRAGDFIQRTHTLPRVDAYTFTALGRHWTDQQWGAQVLFSWVYRLGGWPALALLRAATVGLIFLFVLLACRAAGSHLRQAAWLTLGAFLVSVGGLGLRPQLFAMVLFALTVWLVFDRRKHPGRLWLVPAIAAVWANVHGSFFLAPLLLAFAWLEDRHERSGEAVRTLLVGAASAAATLLNPFGPKVWSYAAGISTNKVITRLIVEWQPPTVRGIPGAVFFVSAAVVVAILARRDRPTPWPTLLALGVFFAIGLFAVRGIFWWAFVAPPLLASVLASPEREPARAAPNVLNIAIALGLVALAVAFLPWWQPAGYRATYGLVDQAPLSLTRRLSQLVGPGDRIFNAQVWGSWFEFALPANPVFVDARIEVFPVKVWHEYSDVSTGRQGWQDILNRWDVNVVAIDRGQQASLIPRMRRDPGWRLVFEDKKGLIFVRR